MASALYFVWPAPHRYCTLPSNIFNTYLQGLCFWFSLSVCVCRLVPCRRAVLRHLPTPRIHVGVPPLRKAAAAQLCSAPLLAPPPTGQQAPSKQQQPTHTSSSSSSLTLAVSHLSHLSRACQACCNSRGRRHSCCHSPRCCKGCSTPHRRSRARRSPPRPCPACTKSLRRSSAWGSSSRRCGPCRRPHGCCTACRDPPSSGEHSGAAQRRQ